MADQKLKLSWFRKCFRKVGGCLTELVVAHLLMSSIFDAFGSRELCHFVHSFGDPNHYNATYPYHTMSNPNDLLDQENQ